MKKILVPTDFSEHSNYALQVAAQIAKKSNAKILLFHMMGIAQSVFISEEDQKQAEAIYYLELTRKRFNELLEKDFMKGVETEVVVQNYKMFSEMNNLAHDKGVDFVVMGSHGYTGLSEMFVGSNTEKIIRTSDFPVMVIKEPCENFNMKKVVFACDFKPDALKAYRKAMHFFNNFGSEVHLLYVNLPNEEFRSTSELDQRVNEFLSVANEGVINPNHKVHYFNDYNIESGIYAFSKAIEADVVSLATHGRKGVSHFFMGSVGEDIATHVNLPVITFKI
ncbi:Nucleotide-binding universal stress protein, UspA family [Zhouia amylolytica]|uniref:Nucleotide-binding universal stress protein, UspA family n=1 Tax=Zhouia amylolytica TaxID=376730 RepID=A0A1I6RMR1_9FLAO|nr:universal stress protein [Zhouia amylolytica]SFS66021.1 Nucleotide-binding universal stress protein, UspA family [Zhouia amylolytica]